MNVEVIVRYNWYCWRQRVRRWEPTIRLIVSAVAALLGALSSDTFTRSNLSGSGGRHSEAPCQITPEPQRVAARGQRMEPTMTEGLCAARREGRGRLGRRGQRQQDGGRERESGRKREREEAGGTTKAPASPSLPPPPPPPPAVGPGSPRPLCTRGGSGDKWPHVNHV